MSNSEVNDSASASANANSKRIIIGISGASGFQYGVRLLEVLRNLTQCDAAKLTGKIETHLVISKAAQQVRALETQYTSKDVQALADVCHPIDDIACSLASGSYQTLGMIVAPCSMRTLAAIASGVTGNALTRAADVMLKERRRLVLMVRESPLHAGHCENMLKVTQMGAIIAPPVPAFYNHPQTINDIIDHSVGRVLDLFDLGADSGIVKRWG